MFTFAFAFKYGANFALTLLLDRADEQRFGAGICAESNIFKIQFYFMLEYNHFVSNCVLVVGWLQYMLKDFNINVHLDRPFISEYISLSSRSFGADFIRF